MGVRGAGCLVLIICLSGILFFMVWNSDPNFHCKVNTILAEMMDLDPGC